MALALDAEIISEFLSSYDFSELPSVQLENGCNGGSSGDSGPEKQATGARHKLYRKRCRAERESLEQEINELNLKLGMEPRRQLSMSSWRMVSKCHLAARLVSEERQRRLYATVSAQSALIHQYQGLIQGSPVPGDILPMRMDRHYQHKKMRVESFDTAFYKATFDTVDTIYAQTDEIFEKIGIDATGDNCATFTRAMASDSGEKHFQYLDKRTFPASFKLAAIAQ